MSRAIALCLVAIVAAASASVATAQEKDETRIERAELFPGDLARLAPHLELSDYGCVKTSFVGNKKFSAEVEIWQNGQAKAFAFGGNDPRTEGLVSFSLREIRNDKNEAKYRLTVAGGGLKSSREFDLPKVQMSNGITSQRLSKETTVKDGVPVAIWVMSAGEGSLTIRDESIEAHARRVEWAMVLKIRFDESNVK
jgi:hypothetical protein